MGSASIRRRKAGGKLALGRDSCTRASLSVERAAVMARGAGWCEIGQRGHACDPVSGKTRPATDFAHVIARSQGGADVRSNALALCRRHHEMMTAPFSKGRLLAHTVIWNKVTGIQWRVLVCADKAAYYIGEYTSRAAGFIAT